MRRFHEARGATHLKAQDGSGEGERRVGVADALLQQTILSRGRRRPVGREEEERRDGFEPSLALDRLPEDLDDGLELAGLLPQDADLQRKGAKFE